ncbi:MAG: zinc-binding protein, partial [Methanobrevibacter sp.]|nr:zinc-binding protein [Methanobrevibacter sp.]
GTPLVFKQQIETSTTNLGPIIIQKEVSHEPKINTPRRTSRWLIIFGYVFSILGGILGLIIAIYLSTRKDPYARKHGHIQLAIFVFYIALIAILFATGNMPADAITQYRQMLAGNFTSL